MPEVLDVFRTVAQWVFAPIIDVLWYLFRLVGFHTTEIAVLRATQQANKEAHDREFKEMRTSFKAVLDKLDSIEQHLRK